ncbi:MAG: hypothetical protein L6R42_001751 [Xanthoria sp. 1 TBL-2021]|nr:MAG: hypothetical protein L6R42_001751 [Xanthoria sp. 1 TBL-2021]
MSVTAPHRTTPTTPTTSTNNTQPMPTPTTSPSMGLASTSVSTLACDNLRDAISFRYKKPPPRNVIYLPDQMQIGQQLQMSSQAPVAGIVQPQQQQQGIVGQAQQPGTSVCQAPPVFQTLHQEQQQAIQPQLPTSTSADPVRYTTWGPKTVYYVDNLPDSESSKSGSKKKKSNRKAKKNKEKKEEGIMFQKVILNGSEQMQTSEKIEVLGPEQGGGIKKTWVCVTRTEVVSVEKQVEEKDVVVESSDDEESSSGSEDTSDDDEPEKQKVKKAKHKGGERKQVAVREVRGEEKMKKKKKNDVEKAMEEVRYGEWGR